jgi:hypothetical protein
MEAVVGGVMVGLTIAVAWVFWQLLVRPDALLSLWQERPHEGWFEEQHPVGLSALRWVTGAMLVLLGFLTGLVWTFLVYTAG